MATITAQPGIKTAFAGGVDDIICAKVDGFRKGVQISTEGGLALNTANIEAKSLQGSVWQEIPEHTHANYITVGDENTPISAIRISGAAGGSYFVTFTTI